MNTQKPPFDDVRVRQAMNYAVDKDQLVNVVFRGYASVMDAPIAAPAFGYAPQEPYSYDPEKAKALLTEAGYPDGFSVKVLTFTGEEYRTAGQVLQQMFADVGVTMELDSQERGALVEPDLQALRGKPDRGRTSRCERAHRGRRPGAHRFVQPRVVAARFEQLELLRQSRGGHPPATSSSHG